MLTYYKDTYGKCNTVITKKNADSFITVDNGATEHAVNNLDYFEKLGTVEHVKLTMEDGATAVATNIGEVLVQV